MKVTIDAAGFRREIEAGNEAIREAVRQAVTDSCAEIEAEAKARCPKDTGNLHSSIASDVQDNGDKVTGVVGTDVDYAPYVHEGTGIHSRTGLGRMSVPWRYKDDKGNWHTTSGNKPQPFLEEAADAKRERVAAIFAEHLKGGGK